MSGRLAGRRAVVVGAGQTPGSTMGNGRAIALRLAEEGARVLLVDRDAGSLAQTAAMIPGGAATHVGDITDDDGPAAIVRAAGEALGGIDVLVNNVGVGSVDDAPADRITDAAFDRIMAVNLRAMLRSIRAALPMLRDDGGGAIVNISSLASVAPAAILAYSIAKAGVNRLTQSVALHEAANGVRCNAVLPGLIDTPMAIVGNARREARDEGAVRTARIARVPVGRMGEAIDVANAVLFLASDEARYITGALLPVDGGMAARVG